MVLLDLHDRLERAGGRVGDEEVQAAVGGRGGLEELVDLRGLLDVGGHGDGVTAGLLGFGPDLLGQIGVLLVVDDDRAPAPGQAQGQRPADAAGRAGDQGHLAGVVAHWTFPRMSRAMTVFWISLVPSSNRWARASR